MIRYTLCGKKVISKQLTKDLFSFLPAFEKALENSCDFASLIIMSVTEMARNSMFFFVSALLELPHKLLWPLRTHYKYDKIFSKEFCFIPWYTINNCMLLDFSWFKDQANFLTHW